MSKVYAIEIGVKVDGQDKTLAVFARADTAAKAVKSVIKVRRATVDDFVPPVPAVSIPSSDPYAEAMITDVIVPSSTPGASNE